MLYQIFLRKGGGLVEGGRLRGEAKGVVNKGEVKGGG